MSMAEEYRDKVDDLLREASALANGSASKIALLEEAVRLADTHQDVPLAFAAREELIEAAEYSGRPDLSLIAFTWCLAQFDRNPGEYHKWTLLWPYKWIIDSLMSFPQISLDQFFDAVRDFKRRLRRAGIGLRAIHKLRVNAAEIRGNRRGVRRLLRVWERSPRDAMSDCPACDADRVMDHYVFLGDDQTALKRAKPILEGKLHCAEIPHRTLAGVLLPLVRQSRLDEAAEHHLRGYRMIKRNPHFLNAVGEHLSFLALTDNLAEAVALFERHVAWSLDSPSLHDRYEFYLATRFLTDRLAQAGRLNQPVRVPRTFTERTDRSVQTIADLKSWIESETDSLAARFDQRNGTNWYKRRIAELRKLTKFVQAFPLAAVRERARQMRARPNPDAT
jgi:hypothetical protein